MPIKSTAAKIGDAVLIRNRGVDAMSRMYRLVAVAALFGAGGSAIAQQAICQLRAEPSEIVRDCLAIVGYSGGMRVGEFQINEGFDRKSVGTNANCLLNERYHRELGRIIAPNRIVVGSRTFMLAPDCRSATAE